MKNCGIASLFLDKEKFYPILSQNQNIFLMTGTIYKRMGKVEELIPINNDFVQILYIFNMYNRMILFADYNGGANTLNDVIFVLLG